jgi:hypothetical protein
VSTGICIFLAFYFYPYLYSKWGCPQKNISKYFLTRLVLWHIVRSWVATAAPTKGIEMKDFKVTVKSESGSISYAVFKTEKGAMSLGRKVAKEAFYGEVVEIIVEAI